MPDPADYDSEESWMEACVPTMVDEGKPQDQAVAACLQMWRDKAVEIDVSDPASLTKNYVRRRPVQMGEVKNLEVANAYSRDRAWSTLTVKSLDVEQRTIEGIASTPTVDRVGDIVEPMGAKFTLPIPLLHHHKSDQPVGQVIAARATKAGIEIKAQLARVVEPGALKDRVDLAWQEIKAGLVRGLSIGFKPLKDGFEPIDPKDPFGGLRFNTWNWYELSLVTIPANADASITLVKSIDQGLQAATGTTETVVCGSGGTGGATVTTGGANVATGGPPGASGKKASVNLKSRSTGKMSTTAEQIAEFEAMRAAKAAARTDLMEDVAKTGETLDAEQEDKYDDLDREVKAIDKHLSRLYDLEQDNKKTAKPVQEVKTVEDGAHARAGVIRVRDPEMPKGIRFARVARCLALAQGNRSEALRIAKSQYGSDQPTIATLEAALNFGEVSDMAVKAPVPAASTQDTQWAGALVTAVSGESGVVGDFLEFLRPQTILGKFGTNGVPDFTRVPFRTGLVTQHSGGSGFWVGEGSAKPVTKIDLSRRTLLPTKVANIAVVTEELLRDGSPSADGLIRNSLAGAIAERMDSDFIDPAITASGARPASITNGVTAIASASAGGTLTGGTAASVRRDIRAVMAGFIGANNPPTSGVWIMKSTTALNLSMMVNSLGEPDPLSNNISMAGGTFAGLPVIVSDYVPAVGSPTGDYVVLVNAKDIWFADEGGLAIDVSREASIEMDSNPTGQAFTGSPGSVTGMSVTSQVNLWQQNLVGWRAERTVNWARARLSGVQVLESVNWGEV